METDIYGYLYGNFRVIVFASKVRNMIPIETKDHRNVEIFKNKISKLQPNNSDRKLFQENLHKIG